MRILSLEADHFKRIRAVRIIPKGNVVEVSGDNEAGKTSTLDAIWAALGGKDAIPAKPIRSGQEEAEIRLVLGEGDETKFIVRRRFKMKDGELKIPELIVESVEGARFSSPETMMKALLGRYAFDPLEFTRLKDPEQVVALRAFVEGVDFEQIEGLNRKDFDDRKELNRKAKELRAQAAGLPMRPDDAPERVNVETLQAKLGEAATHNADVATRKANRESAAERVKRHKDEAFNLRANAAQLIEQAKEAEGNAESLQQQIDNAEALPDPIDVTQVQADIQTGQQQNAALDRYEQRESLELAAEATEKKAEALTGAMAKRKADAAEAVAKSKMPVPGLGFADDEDGKPYVVLNGEPFAQSSTAQKIKTSVAIAAALNPKLRVARIADGSLLDKKSWAQLEELATEHNLQIWCETVEAKSATAIVIEDGGVAGAPEPEPLSKPAPAAKADSTPSKPAGPVGEVI